MAYAFTNDVLPGDISIGKLSPTSKVLGEFMVPVSLSSATDAVTRIVFTAPYSVIVRSVTSRFGTASSSGTYQLENLPSGTASGSGTAMLTSPIALSGTADTNVTTLPTAGATLASGSSLNIIFAGTMTGLVKAGITILISRV